MTTQRARFAGQLIVIEQEGISLIEKFPSSHTILRVQIDTNSA